MCSSHYRKSLITTTNVRKNRSAIYGRMGRLVKRHMDRKTDDRELTPNESPCSGTGDSTKMLVLEIMYNFSHCKIRLHLHDHEKSENFCRPEFVIFPPPSLLYFPPPPLLYLQNEGTGGGIPNLKKFTYRIWEIYLGKLG